MSIKQSTVVGGLAVKKITPSDFYDFFPPNRHRTGDIWRDLPCFGLLNRNSVAGIVITPSCDLANRKCETITYLPVLSIRSYCSSPAFYYEVWQTTAEILSKLKLTGSVISPNRFELPILDELSAAVLDANKTAASEDQKKQLKRLVASNEYFLSAKSKSDVSFRLLETIFTEKGLFQLLSRIVTNAFKADIHFLPSDAKPVESSAVSHHSLALFRYPITIPVELLDLAQTATAESWGSISKNHKNVSAIFASATAWPIRLATMKDDFLSDMLSRYLSTYIRMGSRDFTDGSIDEFVGQLRST